MEKQEEEGEYFGKIFFYLTLVSTLDVHALAELHNGHTGVVSGLTTKMIPFSSLEDFSK